MVGVFTDAAEDRIRARGCLVACLFAVVTSYFVAGIGEMTSDDSGDMYGVAGRIER